jgi:hypothetical protein
MLFGTMRHQYNAVASCRHPGSLLAVETADNVALTYSSTYQDGNSPPTASVATYGLSPNMHVCKPNNAMVGIHQSQNNLFCAD